MCRPPGERMTIATAQLEKLREVNEAQEGLKGLMSYQLPVTNHSGEKMTNEYEWPKQNLECGEFPFFFFWLLKIWGLGCCEFFQEIFDDKIVIWGQRSSSR